MPLKHLEQCPRQDGCAAENAAKRVVLEVRIVKLAADHLEASPAPSCKSSVGALRLCEGHRSWCPVAQEVAR
eukprot:scaffold34809_cov69-Phaeocystis_antarctica.AAC.3